MDAASDVLKDSMNLRELATEAMPDEPSLAEDLQDRVDDLKRRFGTKKRPNADSVYIV